MSKKKKLITITASNLFILFGSITFGMTVDMEFVHFLILISLFLGGYMSCMAFDS